MDILSKDFDDQIELALQKGKAYILSKFQLSSQDLEDVLQDSALKAMKNFPYFRGGSSFDTWFISICRNEVFSLFRKNKKNDQFLSQGCSLNNNEQSSYDPEVFSNSLLEDRSFVIDTALNALSFKHQEVIKIALKNSVSSQEVADILKIPVNSVRTRLFYAKRKLKKLIEFHAHKSNIQLSSY